MALPTLDLSRAYTNESRRSSTDAYRKAMVDYYKQLNPTYTTGGDWVTTRTPVKKNASIWDIFFGPQTAYDTRSIKSPTVTHNPWESNVNSIGSTDSLLENYYKNRKIDKPTMQSSRGGARRTALQDYVSGRVY